MSDKKKLALKYVLIAVFILSASLMLACEIFKASIFGTGEQADVIYSLTSRFFGITLCFALVFYCGFSGILKITRSPFFKSLLYVLPCWAIALNNFPIIPYLQRQAHIDSGAGDILLFALQCLSVGIFEELAYRGCVFMLVLRNNRDSTKQIFKAVIISSALFGAVHIVNLFAGGGPVAVVLQVGYSFLIGAMCCFVLLKTGSVWHCALIHAVYNFCGGLVSNYGSGSIWTVSEIALTAIVAVIVTIYVVFAMFKVSPKECDRLFEDKKDVAEGEDGNL